MRSDDKVPPTHFPAGHTSRTRVCPACERVFGGKPSSQQCCSTKCAVSWKRSKKPAIKPPRFNVIEGKRVELYDPDDISVQDDLWRERSTYWESVANATPTAAPSTLSIAGHGSLIRVDGNTLVLRSGFTHYPQRGTDQRFTPRDKALPERIIVLASSGSITIEALSWLARNQIPIVLVDWRGKVVSTFSCSIDANLDLELRAKLRALNGTEAVQLARFLIERKLAEQLLALDRFPATVSRTFAREGIRREVAILPEAQSIEEIRLIEARAAVAYFRLWTTLPIRWKGVNARPVPAEWLSIGLRSSAIGNTNRHATHPANALLNYAFAGLESQVTVAIAKSGLDLESGVLHARRPGRPALTLDLMEPLRPVAEGKVADFMQSHVFARADFLLGDDGVVRLQPQLARAVIAATTVDARTVESGIAQFKNYVRSFGLTARDLGG
jgi:CRISP-associated protein Cas1